MSTQDRNSWLNGKSIAEALGCSEWTVYAVKKANKEFAQQAREALIFTGRLSTPAKVSAWLQSHPDFIPSRVLAAKRVRQPRPQHQAA
jgi:transcriptional regulator